MKNLKSISLLFICLTYSLICVSQNSIKKESSFWSRVTVGGNLGANFSNNFSSVIVAPQAIYGVNDFVGLGVGLNYSYTELDADRPGTLDYTSNIYGGSFIGLFNPIPELQASFDFEMLNVNRNFEIRSFDDQFWEWRTAVA